MPKNPKTKNSGLGNAIRNKQGKKNAPENRASGRMKRTQKEMKVLEVHNPHAPQLRSVTEMTDLQEFVDTVVESQKYDQSKEEIQLIVKDNDVGVQESKLLADIAKSEIYDYKNLPIPRRPHWNEKTTSEELDKLEQFEFIQWRRNLAHTAEKAQNEKPPQQYLAGSSIPTAVMTPFEKNLNIWRQLWRVIERSDLLCVIVDARNPLAYISRDMWHYIQEMNEANALKPNYRKKYILLLVNKADYLTPLQRQYWSEYFESQHMKYVYFSAMNESIRMQLLSKSSRDELPQEYLQTVVKNSANVGTDSGITKNGDNSNNEVTDKDIAKNKNNNTKFQKFYRQTHIFTTEELLEHFKIYQQVVIRDQQSAQQMQKRHKEQQPQQKQEQTKEHEEAAEEEEEEEDEEDDEEEEEEDEQENSGDEKEEPKQEKANEQALEQAQSKIEGDGNDVQQKKNNATLENKDATEENKEEQNEQKNTGIVVGMVGYPNVGKSSIINVLWGAKKVGVAATPGKTKHFQTLILSEDIMLCDCPGLVFPTMMSSKADLVLNGVLSIDTLTDFLTPSRLMFHRLGAQKIIDLYNLNLSPSDFYRKTKRHVTVFEVLDSYCAQKSLYGHLQVPVRNEASRAMLKDYVRGKLLYSHPPPHLTEHERYLFQHGDIIRPKIEDDTVENIVEETTNGVGQEEEVEEVEQAPNSQQNNKNAEKNPSLYDITDEEFLELWKHPLDNYSEGKLGTSKSKHEKKARVLRRIEKKQSKKNRLARKDPDNFKYGSNMISTSCVPFVSTVHGRAEI